MRVIVTRPEREAQDWVQALQQAGYAAQALPLIGIGPAPDLAAVQQAWRQLHQYLELVLLPAAGGFRLAVTGNYGPAAAWILPSVTSRLTASVICGPIRPSFGSSGLERYTTAGVRPAATGPCAADAAP